MILFHNPRALHPLDPTLFPGIGQVRVDEGDYAETGPVRVLWSQTTTHDFLGRRDGHPSWAKYPSEGETP